MMAGVGVERLAVSSLVSIFLHQRYRQSKEQSRAKEAYQNSDLFVLRHNHQYTIVERLNNQVRQSAWDKTTELVRFDWGC